MQPDVVNIVGNHLPAHQPGDVVKLAEVLMMSCSAPISVTVCHLSAEGPGAELQEGAGGAEGGLHQVQGQAQAHAEH